MENNQESEVKLEENIVITDATPLSYWKPPPGYVPEPYRRPIPAPSTEDGEVYGLPEGWKVEMRPRTNPKYHGKYDKIYYDPGRKNQFRSKKQALNHLREIEAKRNNDQQQPQSGPKNDLDQASGEKDGKQTEVSLEHPKGDSRDEPSPKRKKTYGVEFDFTKPSETVTRTLADAEKPSVETDP